MKREKDEDKSVEGARKRMRVGETVKRTRRDRQTDRQMGKKNRKKEGEEEEGKQWQTRERT